MYRESHGVEVCVGCEMACLYCGPEGHKPRLFLMPGYINIRDFTHLYPDINAIYRLITDHIYELILPPTKYDSYITYDI